MATTAILAATVTTTIDASIESDWPEKISYIYSNQPDGARALLATVAGSMITVTGITFSLTLLAVSHATSQFGPRLLTNFMRDRGNQITLGTFIATFLYCLMVLRTVRSSEELPASGDPVNEITGAFVPHVSISVALLLTIASVGVLIYFIHHIPESIRLSNVVSDVGHELIEAIDVLFPESIAHDKPESAVDDPRANLPDHFEELATLISSHQDGYIQAIDDISLMEIAGKNDLIIKLCARPGDFVSRDMPLLFVSPSEHVTDEICENLRFAFAWGVHRTANQNSLFLVDQLVEVTARALSPGVNDPMTAMTCIDWMQSALIQLTQRKPPSDCRFDSNGDLRIVTRAVTFYGFCEAIFDQLRPYVASDRNAALHMMRMASTVSSVSHDEHRKLLTGYQQELVDAAAQNGLSEHDMSRLKKLQVAKPIGGTQ